MNKSTVNTSKPHRGQQISKTPLLFSEKRLQRSNNGQNDRSIHANRPTDTNRVALLALALRGRTRVAWLTLPLDPHTALPASP